MDEEYSYDLSSYLNNPGLGADQGYFDAAADFNDPHTVPTLQDYRELYADDLYKRDSEWFDAGAKGEDPLSSVYGLDNLDGSVPRSSGGGLLGGLNSIGRGLMQGGEYDGLAALLGVGMNGFDYYNRYKTGKETAAQNKLATEGLLLDRDWNHYTGATKEASDQTTKARDNALLRQYIEMTQPYNQAREEAILSKDGVDISALNRLRTDPETVNQDRLRRSYLDTLLGYENNFNLYAGDLISARDIQDNYRQFHLPRPNFSGPMPITDDMRVGPITDENGIPMGGLNTMNPLFSSIPETATAEQRAAYMTYLNGGTA